MVSISTIRSANHDKTCILAPGEHDFIQDPSYVVYNSCRVEPASKLINGVQQTIFADKGLLDEAVFTRILSGISVSPFTKPFAIEFLEDCAGRG